MNDEQVINKRDMMEREKKIKNLLF